MLIKCPECDLQISDKAAFCPHCGYVITKSKLYAPKRNPNKRRRLPNGFGQITKITSKKLRNPYRVLVPVGKTQDGKYIQKPLKPTAYFETYNKAYEALVEYNRDPYDLTEYILTIKELYEKWFDEYRKTLTSKSSERTITSAWKYCTSIYDTPVNSIRTGQLKDLINNASLQNENGTFKEASAGTKSRIKSMFNLMFDYALEYGIVDKNYARNFSLSDEVVEEVNTTQRPHIAFTDDEIKKLWENIDVKDSYIDVLLFQCYSGWRPQELGLLEIKNVDLDKWEITGGMKTPAGKNRIVPVHPLVRDIVINRYNEAKELGSNYLFNCTDGQTHKADLKLSYDKYEYRFTKIIDSLGLNPDHRPHDGKKTFVTKCKRYNVDEYAVKYIAGHKISDITESVYTERDPQWLHDEIQKIK